MKILVTGASGKIGVCVVRELLQHGHSVRAFDRRGLPSALRSEVEVVYGELTDRLGILRAAQDCEAIAHLAAVPNPMQSVEDIFIPNVVGTQYMLAAAEANDIQRVVLASSFSAYGMAFAVNPIEPQYLPVDEAHPMLPQDLYGLSKRLNEETAAAYTRRCGMATTCLRLTYAVDFESPHRRWMKRNWDRAMEWKSRDMWSYIELRDAARAFRLALEKVESGHHAVIVAARDNFGPCPGRELIERHYPELLPYLDNFDADGGFLATKAAEELFGFVAEYFWRDVADWEGAEKAGTP